MTVKQILKEGAGIPEVTFNESNNSLLIAGVCMPENATQMFKSIFDFIDNKIEKSISLVLKIKYLNSMSSKQLLRLLFEITENYEPVVITWYYKKEDDLMRMKGEELFEIIEAENFTLSAY